MKQLIVIVTILTSALLTSCCGCKGAISKNPYTLTGYKWTLTELNRHTDIASDSDESFTLMLNEKDGQAYGKAACNRYFFAYTEAPVRKIDFSNGGSTRAMCRDSQTETKYLAMMENVDSYTIDGDMLMLLSGGEVVAIFKASNLEEADKQ